MYILITREGRYNFEDELDAERRATALALDGTPSKIYDTEPGYIAAEYDALDKQKIIDAIGEIAFREICDDIDNWGYVVLYNIANDDEQLIAEIKDYFFDDTD